MEDRGWERWSGGVLEYWSDGKEGEDGRWKKEKEGLPRRRGVRRGFFKVGLGVLGVSVVKLFEPFLDSRLHGNDGGRRSLRRKAREKSLTAETRSTQR